jgi:hypothetical protein
MSMAEIETPLATLRRTAPGWIEVQLRSGVCVDVDGLARIMYARKKLAQGRPAAVLAEIPNDVDFEVSVMLTDHHLHMDVAAFTGAMAFVYPGTLFNRLVQVYCRFRPPPFPYRFFKDRAKAEEWLKQVVPAMEQHAVNDME